MDSLRHAWQYVQDNPDKVEQALWVHLRLSLTALAMAMVFFIPLGVLASRTNRVGPTLVAGVGAARVVPSLAVLFLLLPVFGLGERPALVALFLLAGPPLVINTDAGLRAVDRAVLENARGLGMNAIQAFARVQAPLALPVVVAGIRTATIEVVASATLAAFIGAGGFGTFITSGLALRDVRLLLVGAIPVTALAFLAEALLSALERWVSPPVARPS